MQSIVKEFYEMLVTEINMPAAQKRFVVERLGDIEYRLSIGGQ